MIELPDDELDKLFRKSSEEFDPTYEPEDWDALSKRLDQADGKKPAGWWWKWVPLGLLVFFIPAALMMYYGADKSVSDKNKKVISVSKIKTDKEKQKVEVKELNISNAENQSVINKNTSFPKIKAQHNKEQTARKFEYPETQLFEKEQINKIAKTLPRSRSKAGGVYLEPNRSKRGGGYGAISLYENEVKQRPFNNISKNQVVEKQSGEKPEATDFSKAGQNVSGNEINNVAAQEKGRLSFSVIPLDHLPFTAKSEIQLPEIEQQEQKAAAQENRQRDLSPKMAVRFGYSPDLSTVGFKNYSKPGKAVSLLVEYAVLRKLYIQTGVIGSIKEYRANAGEYELKKYVTDIATPSTIDGICNMIEIPLGVRYDFTQTDRSRWFAGTGFSSYYLKKEKYTYNYVKHVPGSKYNWQGENTGLALFSHLNLSAGYEYRISNKLSLLAEPYLKVPLKGIGYGKVNLMTTGMWLSVRYTPVFK